MSPSSESHAESLEEDKIESWFDVAEEDHDRSVELHRLRKLSGRRIWKAIVRDCSSTTVPTQGFGYGDTCEEAIKAAQDDWSEYLSGAV